MTLLARRGSLFRTLHEAAPELHAGAAAGLAAGLWLIMALIVAAFLYGERQEALRRATASAEALVLMLEGHTARTFQAVDVTLAGISASLRRMPELPRHDPVFHDLLVSRLQALQPYARAIFVVGPDGRIVQDTDYPATPDLPLDDRDYFKAHQTDPALERYIAQPLRSRSGLGWFLAVTRPVGDARFQGVVAAALQPQYFERMYSRLGLGGADSLMLLHRDGTLIARFPHQADMIGKSFAEYPPFRGHLPQAAAGSFVTRGGVYPHERLVSYRVVDSMPLVVAMAQSTHGILGAWRERVLGAALGLGVLAALLAALVAQFLRAERLRDRARERSVLTEKLEALGHLSANVSRDFAGLVADMTAGMRSIVENASDPARVREAVAKTEPPLMRGTRLVDQLRTFARRQPLVVRPVDLNGLLESGMELLRHATGDAIALRVEPGAGTGRCLLDDTELELALVHLLVNAADAGAGRVLIRTYRTERHVCLAVIDDGQGMSEEVRRRAFEPYFSTKADGGTGLGLAQVYGFLRQVGGDVSIESQPGKGTAVCLMFLRGPDEAPADAPRA